jgi:acid phosphatase family membrane protein YuiD
MDLKLLALTFAQTSLASPASTAALNTASHANPGLTRGWQVILVTVMCSCVAQLLKLITKLIRTGKLDLRVLAKTGGMPSSHSSCTMGMAVTVGLIEGFNSVSFAIALGLAMIVMYDAAGVRRHVGLQARVLNQMMEELFSDHPHLSSERIKEFLGHTPVEVLVGAILGSAIAWAFNTWTVTQFQPV